MKRSIFLFSLAIAPQALAQSQGPPTEPQTWAQTSSVMVLLGQVRAGSVPGAVYVGTDKPDAPAANVWRESDLRPWGVPENARAVFMHCNLVSTPRKIPLPYVQGTGQVGEPPTYGVTLYFAAADDAAAVCPTDGSKYSIKVSLGLGGVTRVPFSILAPVSGGKLKHCRDHNFPASIPSPTAGGPTLAYTCQPAAAFVGG